MTRTRSAILSIAVAGLTALSAPAAGQAAGASPDDTVTWGIRPAASEIHGAERANYYYEVDAGETIDDAIVVTNHGEREVTVLVYAADAFTTPDGALDLLARGAESSGVGAWATTSHPQVTVPPAGSVEVPFTIEVPDNATPGDHAGGVVTSLVSAHTEENLTVDRRLGSRIHLRVEGDIAPAMGIEGVEVDYQGTANPFGAGSSDVAFELVNTGNIRLSGEQTVVVSGPFGFAARSLDVDVAEMLPGDKKPVEVRLDGVLPLLWLGADVTLHPSVEGGTVDVATETITASAATAAIPWSLLALLLLAALVAVFLIRRHRRRRAAEDKRVADAVAAALREATAG